MTLMVLLMLAWAVPSGNAAVENAEAIDINTGAKGLVPFPHRGHQTFLMDCNICHEWFPQEKESILNLKTEGRLKKRQIMKDLCIQCHADTRKTGEKSGPESCSQCHTKR